jgi:hypothetical protein
MHAPDQRRLPERIMVFVAQLLLPLFANLQLTAAASEPNPPSPDTFCPIDRCGLIFRNLTVPVTKPSQVQNQLSTKQEVPDPIEPGPAYSFGSWGRICTVPTVATRIYLKYVNPVCSAVFEIPNVRYRARIQPLKATSKL